MKIKAKVEATDNVTFEKYDIEPIRRVIPEWDELPKPLRKEFCEVYVEPSHIGTVSNVTCDGLHRYIASVLTLSESDSGMLDPPAELAFGDDDSTFNTNDNRMNNEVGERTPITDPSNNDKNFNIDEYLSSVEQNGNTLREIGIFSNSGDMWQHSATDQVYEKDDSFAIVINVTIPFGDAT